MSWKIIVAVMMLGLATMANSQARCANPLPEAVKRMRDVDLRCYEVLPAAADEQHLTLTVQDAVCRQNHVLDEHNLCREVRVLKRGPPKPKPGNKPAGTPTWKF